MYHPKSDPVCFYAPHNLYHAHPSGGKCLGQKFLVTHSLFPITITCIFVKNINICFTELFFYQLNFKLNISLLEDAKFPQRDPVVT